LTACTVLGEGAFPFCRQTVAVGHAGGGPQFGTLALFRPERAPEHAGSAVLPPDAVKPLARDAFFFYTEQGSGIPEENGSSFPGAGGAAGFSPGRRMPAGSS